MQVFIVPCFSQTPQWLPFSRYVFLCPPSLFFTQFHLPDPSCLLSGPLFFSPLHYHLPTLSPFCQFTKETLYNSPSWETHACLFYGSSCFLSVLGLCTVGWLPFVLFLYLLLCEYQPCLTFFVWVTSLFASFFPLGNKDIEVRWIERQENIGGVGEGEII